LLCLYASRLTGYIDDLFGVDYKTDFAVAEYRAARNAFDLAQSHAQRLGHYLLLAEKFVYEYGAVLVIAVVYNDE